MKLVLCLLGVAFIFIGTCNCIKGQRERRLHTQTFDLKIAEELSHKLTNLIYQRFEFFDKYRYQFFLGSSNIPSTAWDVLKLKICMKALQGNSSFLMIFGGSSVTAGLQLLLYT